MEKIKILLHFLSDSGTNEYIYLLNGSRLIKNNDQVEARDSRVSEKYIVRDTGFSEKGEIAEEKRNPTLFSGTMQKMQRTVTLCGVLSANLDDNEAMDTLRVHGFLKMCQH